MKCGALAHEMHEKGAQQKVAHRSAMRSFHRGESVSEADCRPLLFTPQSIAHRRGKGNSFSINRQFFVMNRPPPP